MEPNIDQTPLVDELRFRLSAAGDVFLMEFLCQDRVERGVAMPVRDVSSVLDGLLRTARAAAAVGGANGDGSGSPTVAAGSFVQADRILAAPDGAGVAVQIAVGGASLRLSLTRKAALTLAEQLVRCLEAGRS